MQQRPLMCEGARRTSRDLVLTGVQICALMRRYRRTIADIADTYRISMNRVRLVRKNGVRGFLAEEWSYMITGHWPDLNFKEQRA